MIEKMRYSPYADKDSMIPKKDCLLIDKINEISEALNWIVWALHIQQFGLHATDEKLTEYENFLKEMVDDG